MVALLARAWPFVGYGLAAVVVWAWLEAREAIVEERAACNHSKLAAAAAAEREVAARIQAAADLRINQMRIQMQRADEARALAEMAARDAAANNAEHEATIRRLTLENETDDIPDSGACLNAFVLERSIAGLRVRAGSGPNAGNCRDTGAGAICTDTAGLNRADTDTADFAAVTYADTLILWELDRAGLATCNGRLAAIRALEEPPHE